MSSRDALAKLLGSPVKVKLLRLLSKYGEANISRLVRESGSHHKVVERHLRELAEMGIVEERRVGRARIFALNLSNPKVPLLIQLLDSLSEGEP